MALKDEYEQSGLLLFQWRSYIPVLFLIFILFFIGDYKNFTSPFWDSIWNISSLLVSFLGLGIRIFTIGYAPKSTSGRNVNSQVADSISTKGIYSVVRHPLYLGNFLIWLGIALYFHHIWILLFSIFSFAVFYERIMFAEESFLREKFGREFEEWADRTPALIPNFKKFEKSDYSFSVRKVIRREYGGFFAIILVFTLINILGNYVTGKSGLIDPLFLYLFIIGLALYVIIRILNKKTRIFHVEGR